MLCLFFICYRAIRRHIVPSLSRAFEIYNFVYLLSPFSWEQDANTCDYINPQPVPTS